MGENPEGKNLLTGEGTDLPAVASQGHMTLSKAFATIDDLVSELKTAQTKIKDARNYIGYLDLLEDAGIGEGISSRLRQACDELDEVYTPVDKHLSTSQLVKYTCCATVRIGALATILAGAGLLAEAIINPYLNLHQNLNLNGLLCAWAASGGIIYGVWIGVSTNDPYPSKERDRMQYRAHILQQEPELRLTLSRTLVEAADKLDILEPETSLPRETALKAALKYRGTYNTLCERKDQIIAEMRGLADFFHRTAPDTALLIAENYALIK